MSTNFTEVSIQKVKDYWNARPCNIRHSTAEIETEEYFNQVEARKYFVDITEGPRLLAITPNVDLLIAGKLCLGDLPAHSGRGLFAPSFPSAPLAENIVKPHCPRFDPVIRADDDPPMPSSPFFGASLARPMDFNIDLSADVEPSAFNF